ncbi:MAG: GDP-mannose 4,6-dehydratase [Candidatus Omnitrophota bacterium]
MKTILITGGAGFIGSNFTRYIFNKYKDYKIIVVDALTYAANPDSIPEDIKKSDRFEFWYGNVKNQDLIDSLIGRSDIVVHFAAESHVARSILENRTFYVTDVLGTYAVANGVLKNKKIERFIHISTSEVYGTALSNPMTEDHPLNPLTPYASAKAGADRLVYSYFTTYGIPAIIIRPFNQYGPCQHLEKAIPRFITSAILDEPLTVHGDGSARRDWTFVEDTCRAIDSALHTDIEKLKGEVINIGTAYDPNMMEVAKKILNVINKPKDLIKCVNDRPGQVQHHIACNAKAQELLAWKPEVSFDEGITRTINWYEKNRDWWKKMLWMRKVEIKLEDGEKVSY